MLGKELQGRSPDNLQPGWVAVVLRLKGSFSRRSRARFRADYHFNGFGDGLPSGETPKRKEGTDMRGRKAKGFVRVKGRLLQFLTAFGLTLSVTAGFFLGYWAGKYFGVELYAGVGGSLVGFGIGLAYLAWLANRGNES